MEPKKYWLKIRKYLFELTPLGKADKEVRKILKEDVDTKQLNKYESALNYYRSIKVFENILRILLYASIITSIAATVGFDRLRIIQQVASYLGTTLILVLYVVTSYIAMIRKETYHVQREVLISQSTS